MSDINFMVHWSWNFPSSCRKSFKSLLFLLPLLGITNILHHVWPNPLRGSWVFFAVWSITTHFLYSFQGRGLTERSCLVMVAVFQALKSRPTFVYITVRLAIKVKSYKWSSSVMKPSGGYRKKSTQVAIFSFSEWLSTWH